MRVTIEINNPNMETAAAIGDALEMLAKVLPNEETPITISEKNVSPLRINDETTAPAESTTDEQPTEGPDEMEPPPQDAIEVDINGEAWNPEKHASSKAKNKDGTWRARRVVAKSNASTPPPPPSNTPAAPQNIDFVSIMALANEKDVSFHQLDEIAKGLGIESIAVLATREDLLIDAYNAVVAL